MNQDTYYITTPIYYVNDKPHLGHAYTSVAADTLARFMRLDGKDVKFLTGTDEHGQKVEKSAQAAGVSPQDFVDMVSEHFRELSPLLNLSNDDFIRTTEPRHIKSAQAIWKKLLEKGDIYLGSYDGWYCVRDEAFYAESELVDGKAPTGAPVEWVEEPSYFFKLSVYQDKLIAFYEANPDFIQPESRRNEILSFVKGGLKDLSVSRTTFTWGIPVPGDEKHIMYVWLDALVNYLTAAGYPDTNSEMYKKFWPASLHLVGKDIVRFHTVYWPAFLMSADVPLPKKVFAHGWWTIEGEKMSKSLGNVIAPQHLVEKYGLDQTRYFLLREVPFGNDGNFARESLVNRVNSDLANNIGNLAQRVLSMIHKHCEGKIPNCTLSDLTDEDRAQLNEAHVTSETTPDETRQKMQNCKFHEVLGDIVSIATKANLYIDRMAPWSLKKTDEARMRTVLYVLADNIRCIAIMLLPFIPDSAAKMLDILAVPESDRKFNFLHPENMLQPGTVLPELSPVFPRVELETAA